VFFEHQTLRAQAQAIDLARRGEIRGVAAIEPAPRDGFLPLSFEQQSLWVHDRLLIDAAGSLYNEHLAWRLSGQLDLSAFARSVEAVLARHEILRTRFVAQTEGVAQVIESRSPPLQVVRAATRSELELIVRGEREYRFRLQEAPPCRICLVQEATDDSHVLLITLHHIIADGWSQTILLRELFAIYRAIRAGQEPALAPLSIQYADYAYWQQRRFQDVDGQIDLEYWRAQLSQVTRLRLPTDRVRRTDRSPIGGQVAFSFAPRLLTSLRELMRQTGATMYMTLLAALHVLLSKLSGQSDFIILSPMSGRMRSATQGMMGVFVALVPMRLRTGHQQTFLQVLEHARAVTLEAQAHQETSLAAIDIELRARGDTGLAWLSPAAFNFFNQTPFLGDLAVGADSDAGLTSSAFQETAVSTGARNDLLMTVREHASGMDGTIVYATDVFDESTVADFVRRYYRLLRQVLATPEMSIREIDLSLSTGSMQFDESQIDEMSDEDARRLLEEIDRSGGVQLRQ
jgi:condensation domain-containing protein